MANITPEFQIQWLRSYRLAIRTIAQVKLGTSGMFIGRCSTDGRFENKVGMDMLLIVCRKPVWNWHEELQRAEMNIRLVENSSSTGVGSMAHNIGEYYPLNGISPYYLPPDALFAPDWIERAGIIPVDRGPMTGTNKSFSGMNENMNVASKLKMLKGDVYSGDLPGFIFCGTTPIIEEMFSRCLFGLPIQMKDTVIHPNVPLFIFDTQAMLVLGIFHCDSSLGMNIEPTAFTNWGGMGPGGGSPLPVQVKFRIFLESPPIHIQDPELVMALGGNNNIMGPIGVTETKALANLFSKRASAVMSNTSSVGNPKSMGGSNATPANTAFYKPPFKFSEAVVIDIQGSMFDIKKKLLGNNASTIIQLVDEIGSKNSLRIRMRGIGSGFIEGPSLQELQEPLHFNVSADNEPLLQAAVVKVRALIEKAKYEIQHRI